ncbi:hypothetical protein OS493_032933 [Desmophyllum pertusum]|uniref:Uncharacterized protein n=1 Tax=Desmophyllum pertusum TaxID=174260 RepID=A0A9W9YMI4_9CNID|nr:hypothetical protein OS493_032933 [Desmophyllum pertusum]
MALSTTTFCLVLGCLTLSLFHYSSSSSSGKKEKQYCGDEKFYCPTNKQCLDRKLRCTSSKVCVDSNNNEAKCFESSTPGMYKYYKKKTPLPFIGSFSKRKRRAELETETNIELDVNGPYYKYGPGREKVTSEEFMGSSSCTRDEVVSFNNKWLRANPKYRFLLNNCQHFAKKLLKELERNCPNRVRRQDDDTESLKAPSECYNNTSSALPRKLHALFPPLISFAIFYNIN